MLCAVISLFFISKPDGQKLLTSTPIQQDITHSFEQIKRHITRLSLAIFSDTAILADNNNSEINPVTLYRWQDSQGQWHFSNKLDATSQTKNKTTRQTIIVTPNTSISAPQKSLTTAHAETQKTESNTVPTLPTTNAFDTLQDAKNIQTLMNNHSNKLDNTIRNVIK